MKNFGSLGSSFLFSMLIKLGFAILLTYFGFKVYGAITGIVLGGIVSIIILIFTINPIIKEKAVYENFKIRTRENMNIFLAMALIVVFYSLDIILVKFFFSAEIAGEYGAVSTIAKIGLFGTMAVGNAMFPISSERFEKKESSKSIFMKSLGLVSIIGLIFVILVFLFPEQIVNLFYGEKYVALAPIAWKLAVGFIAISLLNLLLLYKISTNGFKTNKSIFMVGLLFLEIIGFFFFHKDISQFSKLFMIQNAIIFILSLILLKK
jgi:O-antigen/teichoic acid export membrane protein